MKFEKNLTIIFYIVLFIGIIKCLALYFSQEYVKLPFLIAGIVWIIWLILSFRFNKDLPGVGPFSYDEGKNQGARIIYTIAAITGFLLAIIFS